MRSAFVQNLNLKQLLKYSSRICHVNQLYIKVLKRTPLCVADRSKFVIIALFCGWEVEHRAPKPRGLGFDILFRFLLISVDDVFNYGWIAKSTPFCQHEERNNSTQCSFKTCLRGAWQVMLNLSKSIARSELFCSRHWDGKDYLVQFYTFLAVLCVVLSVTATLENLVILVALQNIQHFWRNWPPLQWIDSSPCY